MSLRCEKCQVTVLPGTVTKKSHLFKVFFTDKFRIQPDPDQQHFNKMEGGGGVGGIRASPGIPDRKLPADRAASKLRTSHPVIGKAKGNQ